MATIGTNAKIGKGCIISSGATIKRNVILEDYNMLIMEKWLTTRKRSKK